MSCLSEPCGYALNFAGSAYRRYLSLYILKKHITRLKKRPEYRHWNQLGSQAIQEIVLRIHKGYQKFFQGENKRVPTFRKIAKAKSFTLIV
ncbi:MAG TPA: hypothetical protein VFC02_13930 [Anaerolineales bacterium]|nr:hypothetical protein [Anaerolineales bacterium]